MEQGTEKKPLKGEEFLKKVAMRLTGGQNPEKSPEDEAAEYKKRTQAAQAKHDYVTTVDTLANPPSIQAMREERDKELTEERKAAQNRAKEAEDRERQRLADEAEAAATQAAEEKRKREETEQKLQAQHDQMLLDKLDDLKRSQKPMGEQAKEFFQYAQEAATMLGFERPSPMKPQSDDPRIALEIAKLNLDAAREDRKFQLDMEDRKREWDLKMLTFQREGVFKEKELALQAKKDEHLFSLPQAIGGAIAKGLIDHESGAAAPPGRISQKQQGSKLYGFEIGQGQVGQAPCPNCQSPIGIGPTSTEVQCVGCGDIFPVARVAAGPGGQVPTEQEPPPKDEE